MPSADSRTRFLEGSFAGGRWEVARRMVPPHLQPWVRELTGYVERTGAPSARTEFPEPHAVVIIELGPPIRVTMRGDRDAARSPGGFVAGLGERPALTEHDGYQYGIQLNLSPLGAGRFLGVPLGAVREQVVALADLPGGDRGLLAKRLACLPDWSARFDLLEHVLTERLAEPYPNAAVAWAVGRIEAAGGAVDMRGLTRELGYSHKHVIALFREHLGVAPKRYAQLVRFKRAMQAAPTAGISAGRPATWAEVALAAGYYDQAHLARDVRRFTGMTATEAAASLQAFAGLTEAPG